MYSNENQNAFDGQVPQGSLLFSGYTPSGSSGGSPPRKRLRAYTSPGRPSRIPLVPLDNNPYLPTAIAEGNTKASSQASDQTGPGHPPTTAPSDQGTNPGMPQLHIPFAVPAPFQSPQPIGINDATTPPSVTPNLPPLFSPQLLGVSVPSLTSRLRRGSEPSIGFHDLGQHHVPTSDPSTVNGSVSNTYSSVAGRVAEEPATQPQGLNEHGPAFQPWLNSEAIDWSTIDPALLHTSLSEDQIPAQASGGFDPASSTSLGVGAMNMNGAAVGAMNAMGDTSATGAAYNPFVSTQRQGEATTQPEPLFQHTATAAHSSQTADTHAWDTIDPALLQPFPNPTINGGPILQQAHASPFNQPYGIVNPSAPLHANAPFQLPFDNSVVQGGQPIINEPQLMNPRLTRAVDNTSAPIYYPEYTGQPGPQALGFYNPLQAPPSASWQSGYQQHRLQGQSNAVPGPSQLPVPPFGNQSMALQRYSPQPHWNHPPPNAPAFYVEPRPPAVQHIPFIFGPPAHPVAHPALVGGPMAMAPPTRHPNNPIPLNPAMMLGGLARGGAVNPPRHILPRFFDHLRPLGPLAAQLANLARTGGGEGRMIVRETRVYEVQWNSRDGGSNVAENGGGSSGTVGADEGPQGASSDGESDDEGEGEESSSEEDSSDESDEEGTLENVDGDAGEGGVHLSLT